MTFNLRQLEGLDYDAVEPILINYIEGAIVEFRTSAPGQAYLQKFPEAGNWAGTFIEIAYLYGEMTLPTMTKAQVEVVMEQILPRKITLLEPTEADDAVPEIIAFWTFLQQTYKLRSAGAIIKYLNKIQAQFPQWMSDPARGGIAKHFMLQGMQAGYDMTNEEEMKAFQAVYNQNLAATGGLPPGVTFPGMVPDELSDLVTMPATPPAVQQFMDLIGVEVPPQGQQVSPQELFGKMLTAMHQLETSLESIQGKASTVADRDGLEDQSDLEPDFWQTVRTQMLQSEEISLSAQAIELLQSQTITDQSPGTILQDFQMLLEVIIPEGLPTSSKRSQLPIKHLADLNQALSKPVTIALKRPQQSSYPPLHGLYLLLRATGLLRVEMRAKKRSGQEPWLVINSEMLTAWQNLNPTERYFTLLEAWLVRAHAEILSDERSSMGLTEGDHALQGWQILLESSTKRTFANYNEQHVLKWRPGYHNLALMELFGLLEIQSGQPDPDQGWRIKKVKLLPWGKALMAVVRQAYLTENFQWASERNPSRPFNELQPFFKDYFPDWQKSLTLPTAAFRSGRHLFRVSLQKHWSKSQHWSRISIAAEATLWDLSHLILDAVGFDRDHLDMFTYTNVMGRQVRIGHPYLDDCDASTDEVQIGNLPLQEGSVMEYLFDFGDDWTFEVVLESCEPETMAPASQSEIAQPKTSQAKTPKSKQPKTAKSKQPEPPSSQSRQEMGEILEVHGQVEQYPEFEER